MPIPDRNVFYFGTIGAMRLIPAPLQGMENSPVGWSADGTYLNGGGFARNSFDSHKRYVMEWRDSSAPRVAQMMKSYADGTYGRGLLYFHDPTTYEHNVLPSRWADPSMSLGYEGRSLVYGITPTESATASPGPNLLPLKSATYSVNGLILPGYREEDALFIPLPPGHSLLLGAMYSSSSTSSGVYYRTVNSSGVADGAITRLSPIATDSSTVTNTTIASTASIAGVRLWVGKTVTTTQTVTVSAMTARIVRTDAPASKIQELRTGPWVGGMGHSGCRFNGKPTLVTNTAHYGGRMGFAASFIEIGDWYYG